ncbi:MAG: hypothetical protein HRF42_10980 [Candidatus Brocadia sp.]
MPAKGRTSNGEETRHGKRRKSYSMEWSGIWKHHLLKPIGKVYDKVNEQLSGL